MLKLTNLRKSYNGTVAVDGLSLEVKTGEIFGLLGPNGAGKSTIVHLAVGLLAPDSGTVEIAGLGQPTVPAVRARIGVAPQALAVYEELTADENLRLFGTIYGLADPRLAERMAWALELAGLADRRRDKVRDYSGGMKRRLNLAVAVLHEPQLILLDEPTVGVDPQSRNRIFDNIEALRAEGRTIVYTTHYMEEAQRLCDRVAIIDRGRVLAVDTVPGLLATHGGRPTLVLETGSGERRVETDDPLAELNRRAQEGPLGGFRVERPDLEQVFLKLTGHQLRD